MQHRSLLVVVAVMVGTVRPALAQQGIGLVGGYSSATTEFSPSGTVNPTSVSGFAAGLSLASQIAPHLAFAPELLYVQKGYRQSTSTTTSFRRRSSYIELPLLFRMSSGTPNVRLLLLAGPSVAVKVACTDEVTALGTTDERDCVNGDGSSAIKTIDAGVMVGAGVGLRRVSLTARYDIGLANEASSTTASFTSKHRTLLVMIGLALGH